MDTPTTPSPDKKPRPVPVRPSRGPTPVRGATGEPAAEPSSEVRRWVAPDGASFDVRIEGRARTGRGSDPAADLALLVFRPIEVDGRGRGRSDTSGGALEVYAVVGSLQELSDLGMLECFTAARPFRPIPVVDDAAVRPRRRSRRG